MPAPRILFRVPSSGGSHACFAVSLPGGFDGLWQCDQIRRRILIEIDQPARFERLGVPYFQRRTRSIEVEFFPITGHSESKGWTGVEVLLLDAPMILDIPDPPFGCPVRSNSDLRHHRVAALAIRRELESI